jgi:hypothetical protein
MKKKIFMLLALFAGVLSASADNTLAVTDAMLTQGKTGTFNIELNNTDEITACQFNLILPDGLTFVNCVKTSRANDSHSVGKATVGQNTQITFNSSSNDLVTGNSGPLFVVTVDVDASVALGPVQATLANIEITKKDETKFNPADVDFTITITDRVIIDENAITAPIEQTGVNVLVKRTIKGGVWNTIILPFAMNVTKAKAAFGDDVKFAQFSSFTTTLDMDTFTPTAISLNFANYTLGGLNTLKTGTPYLIMTSSDIDEFEVDGVNISQTITPVSKADTEYPDNFSGSFNGTFVATKIPNNGLFLSGNKLYYSKGNTNTKAFRGWIMLDVILNQALDLGAPVLLNVDGEVTKIDTVFDAPDDGQYYNLKGQKVDNPTEKGVYIKNGKKIVVK